jgi:hypothetical protein
VALFILTFVGVALAISLAIAGSWWGRAAVVVILVAIGAITVVVTFWAYDLYLTEQLVESYATSLASAFGVSPLLAKAAAFALFLPAGMALAWVFSFDKAKRRWGSSILAGAAAFYFLALWVATKDQKVSRQGDPLQCYVVTEQGVVWRDIRYLGIDPGTGRPCKPAEAYLLPTLARLDGLLRSGRSLEPIDPQGRFFTPIGDPLVWFYRTSNGDLEFYDAPGFRPRSGDQLQPITRAVVEEWERRETEKAEAERQRSAAVEREKLAAEAAAERQQEEARLAHMRSFVVCPADDMGQALGLSIVPSRPDDAWDRLAAERLPGILAEAAPETVHVIPTMFADGFVKEGHFAKTFAGDPTPLRETEALTCVRHVALGQTETACAPNGSIQGVTSCQVTLVLKVFGEEGRIVDSKHLTAIGPSFSEQGAVVRGVELLVERSGSQVLQAMGR